MMKNRKKLRLRNYNYSQNGMYFVTICTHNKLCLFGNIVHDEMKLNVAGKIVEKWWKELENKFDITLHEYVIMPNHIHGIIEIDCDVHNNVVADLCVSQNINKNVKMCQGQTRRSVPTMMQWFKTMTTNEYIKKVKSGELSPFEKRIWQRSYYDHIIRKEESLRKIREYITINPSEWKKDELYKTA